MAKKWVQSAIKHPGELTRKARAVGMTLSQFMAAPHRDEETRRQINLARTLMAMNHKRGRGK